MNKLNKDDYKVIVAALSAAGYTVDTVYAALKSADFSVEIKGETYEGIYASRVLALMHESRERVTLKL